MILRNWRRHKPQVLTLVALIAGVCGVGLAASPVTSTVAMTVGGVDVDGALLTPLLPQTVPGVQVFNGPASLAINASKGGASHAGAVMIWAGLATTGRCLLHVVGRAASDACQFSEGSARFSAADTFDARDHVWHRRYEDGVNITIAVPAGTPLIPIPFPLGH